MGLPTTSVEGIAHAGDRSAGAALGGRGRDVLCGVLVTAAGAALYAWHTSPVVRYWDAAERALAAAHFGVSHPTGCVLHAAIGKVFLTLVPLTPDYAAGLLSALGAALALGVMYAIARRLSDDRFLCVASTLVLATAALVWSQAVYSEAYAVHALFLAFFLFYYLRWLDGGHRRDLLAAAFLYAISLGVHVSGILLAPWILIGVILRDRSIFRSPRFMAAVALAIFLGMTWLGIIWIRGETYWMLGTDRRPDSWHRLMEFMSAKQFRPWAHNHDLPMQMKRAVGSFALLAYSFLGVGALVAVAGWMPALRRRPAFALLAGGGILTYVVYFSRLSTADVETLIQPCCLFIFLCMVLGWERLAATARRRHAVHAALVLLVAAQAFVFPVLSRQAVGRVAQLPDGAAALDQPTPVRRFWEGVLKAEVSFHGNYQPLQESLRLQNVLGRVPGRKVLMAPWAVQSVLEFYRATENWFPETRIYEQVYQRRFYPSDRGMAQETYNNPKDVVEDNIRSASVFLLQEAGTDSLGYPYQPFGVFWLDHRPYHLVLLSEPARPQRR